MPQLTLYLGPLSLFSRKVEIALREKGLPCEARLVPFTQALLRHFAGDLEAAVPLLERTVAMLERHQHPLP